MNVRHLRRTQGSYDRPYIALVHFDCSCVGKLNRIFWKAKRLGKSEAIAQVHQQRRKLIYGQSPVSVPDYGDLDYMIPPLNECRGFVFDFHALRMLQDFRVVVSAFCLAY